MHSASYEGESVTIGANRSGTDMRPRSANPSLEEGFYTGSGQILPGRVGRTLAWQT
jgi:hypothetical protein